MKLYRSCLLTSAKFRAARPLTNGPISILSRAGCVLAVTSLALALLTGCAQQGARSRVGAGDQYPAAAPSKASSSPSSITSPLGSSPALVVSVDEKREMVRVNSVLVAPMTLEAGARSLSGEAKRLDEALFNALQQELDLQLTAWSDMSPSGSGSRESSQDTSLTSEIVGVEVSRMDVLAAAKKRSAGSVLFTTMHEYQDRKGSAAGATVLARTFFTISLVSVSTGNAIWEATYRFRDQSASENLLALKDRLFKSDEGVPTGPGVGFRAGEELLLSGFRASARELAAARMRSFSVEGKDVKVS